MKNWRLSMGLGATVVAWILAAWVTVMRWDQVETGKCWFVNNWPGCAGFSFNLQALAVTLLMGLLCGGGYVVWKNWVTVDKNSWPRWVGIVGLTVVAVSSLAVLPFTSNDVQFYFSVGRSVAEGHSPYTDPWLRTIQYMEPQQATWEQGVMYGPLIVRLFGAVYEAAHGQMLVFVAYWKLLMLVGWLGMLVAVRALLRSYGVTRDLTWFWFAQPLLLWEWVGNGHFDALWVLTVFGALAFAKKQRWFMAALCLTAGVWLKFIPIIIAPWLVLWWWQGTRRTEWRRAIAQVLGVLGVVGVVSWISWIGLWSGMAVFNGLIIQTKWAVSSIFSTTYYSLFPILQPWLGSYAHLVTTAVLQGALLLVAIYLLYPYMRAAWQLLLKEMQWSAADYVQAVYVTLSTYLLVWQKSFWPWYLGWLIPLAVIVALLKPNTTNRALLGTLSFAPLLFYIPQQWQNGDVSGLLTGYFVALVIIGPSLYWLICWRKKNYDLA